MARRACVVTAAVVSVAGCVGMPSSGPVGAISASPQSTAPAGDVIQTFPSGPQPGESPSQIVGGFLAASANYPFNAAIAREYLVSSAVKTWSPTWSVTVYRTFGPPVTPPPRPGVRQTTVVASGNVQSAFNGTGQFVSAGGTAARGYAFHLTKVNGQWRIANPPSKRLLTVSEFGAFYKPQDLYFLNSAALPGATEQPLVPDSVFVPQGTSTTDLLNNLVSALLPSAGQPKSTLLKTAALTFPARTTLVNVTQAGTTAVVNLGGLKGASTTALEQVSAQLAWTLASPRPGPGAPIQSVELELNGQPFIPPKTICGIRQARSQVQNQATYPCYNPYPSQPASFSFTSHGQVWSRCAAEASVQRGQVGQVVSVLGSATVASLPSCGEGNVPTGSIATPVSRTYPGLGTPSLVAVSPDGQYVACYSPDARKLFTGPASGGTTKLTAVKEIGSGVTALSWDRNHDLWVAENGDVFMVPVNGQTTSVNTSALPGNVTDLSVAPDGIRIALIVQNGSSSVVDLAAIIHGGQSAQGQRGLPSETVSLTEPAVHLGPDLVQPEDLTWYDADNLIVLTGGSGPRLSEVPVDGQQSYNSQLAPPGTDSITANSEMNALVAGLPGEQLAVSTSIEGPWQFLGVHGQNPAYPG
jgi:hypothetical protein